MTVKEIAALLATLGALGGSGAKVAMDSKALEMCAADRAAILNGLTAAVERGYEQAQSCMERIERCGGSD